MYMCNHHCAYIIYYEFALAWDLPLINLEAMMEPFPHALRLKYCTLRILYVALMTGTVIQLDDCTVEPTKPLTLRLQSHIPSS